jgi:hypothetical protein
VVNHLGELAASREHDAQVVCDALLKALEGD